VDAATANLLATASFSARKPIADFFGTICCVQQGSLREMGPSSTSVDSFFIGFPVVGFLLGLARPMSSESFMLAFPRGSLPPPPKIRVLLCPNVASAVDPLHLPMVFKVMNLPLMFQPLGASDHDFSIGL